MVGRRNSIACLLLLSTLLTAGCGTTRYLTLRDMPRNRLTDILRGGSNRPKITARTEQLLRRYDLLDRYDAQPGAVLENLHEFILQRPESEQVYAYAEIAYVEAREADDNGETNRALNLYGTAVAHAYYYLFDPKFQRDRNPYDPLFRQACDLYNTALEATMRIAHKHGGLHPGQSHEFNIAGKEVSLNVVVRGPWHPDEIAKLEFVSDYDVQNLNNKYHNYGLGVPMIAVRKHDPKINPAAQYYPKNLSFPLTAFLRVEHAEGEHNHSHAPGEKTSCTLELYDPLAANHVVVADRPVPLETDTSTPLAYFLELPPFRHTQKLATWGLLNPASTQEYSGIYMMEGYDPNKIPVLLVHGLWSSPATWTQMFNDLRSIPEIHNHYQFWTYLYPTGQPFWISAAQMREDLADIRSTIDPQRQNRALDQMVLVGHSMGGLVSRLQAIDSGNDFWNIVSKQPFSELKADDETKQELAQVMFFQPNSSVRRVVTLGTPHRGSEFANGYTRFLGRSLINIPQRILNTKRTLAQQNPELFHDTDLLNIKTSIDSLAPESPILPVMLNAQKAPWIKFHNVVGVVPDEGIVGKISSNSDGVVAYESAHVEDVVSEVVVDADHVTVHQHPRSILEMRRILRDHLQQVIAEWSHGQTPRTMHATFESHQFTPPQVTPGTAFPPQQAVQPNYPPVVPPTQAPPWAGQHQTHPHLHSHP